jgi:hypothetical protein
MDEIIRPGWTVGNHYLRNLYIFISQNLQTLLFLSFRLHWKRYRNTPRCTPASSPLRHLKSRCGTLHVRQRMIRVFRSITIA